MQIELNQNTQTAFRIRFQAIFRFNSEFRCVQFSLYNPPALGPGKKKTNCLQNAMAQSPWTANDMATARKVGTAGCIFFINFHV